MTCCVRVRHFAGCTGTERAEASDERGSTGSPGQRGNRGGSPVSVRAGVLWERVSKMQEKRESPFEPEFKTFESVLKEEAFQDGPPNSGLEGFRSRPVGSVFRLKRCIFTCSTKAKAQGVFQFVSLCFGLASAPRVFTRKKWLRSERS